jgi:hypothetical protein
MPTAVMGRMSRGSSFDLDCGTAAPPPTSGLFGRSPLGADAVEQHEGGLVGGVLRDELAAERVDRRELLLDTGDDSADAAR